MPNGISVKGDVDMFSVISQEKTPLRDSRGGNIYRRIYLCDGGEDLGEIPMGDAPGSLAYTAAEGKCFVLDHGKHWRLSPGGGVPWGV